MIMFDSNDKKINELTILKGILENINEAISIEVRRSFLQHKAILLIKLKKVEELENIFDEIWEMWRLNYTNLRKLAIRKGVNVNEIISVFN